MLSAILSTITALLTFGIAIKTSSILYFIVGTLWTFTSCINWKRYLENKKK